MRPPRKIRVQSGPEKLLPLLLVVIIIAVYFAFKSLPHGEEPKPAPTVLKAVKVIDGDTFVASNGETIRLLGLDTPEAGQPYYNEATSMLIEMLDTNEIRLEYDYRKRDKYNRLLAYVFTAEQFVNSTLIKSGMASVYIFPSSMKNFEYQQMFIEDQREARQNKLGIWSIPDPQPESFYIGNSRTFRFHRPSCSSVMRLDSNYRLELQSREEFLDLGYSPCRNCNP